MQFGQSAARLATMLCFALFSLLVLAGCDGLSPGLTLLPEATATPGQGATPTPSRIPIASPSAAISTGTLAPSSIPTRASAATATPVAPTPQPIATNPPVINVTPTLPPLPTPPPTGNASPTPTPTSASVTFPIVMWHVSDLLVGPGNPGRVYALQRSDVYTPDHVDNPPMRLLLSDDFGASWQSFAGGLPTGDTACLHSLTMDYATADALYAATCSGIYRWSNNTWTRFSQQSVGALAITYGKPNVMYATGYPPGPLVLKSDNGGATWQAFDTGLVSFSGLANLGIDPRNGTTLYGMINPKYAGSYLRRADSRGHWVTMPVPPTGYTYIGFTIDGATGALYVAVQGNTVWELWRTLNPSEADLDKIRWEKAGDFGPESAGNWAYLVSSGASPQGLALFARIDSGNCSPLQGDPCISLIRRSTDNGRSWTTLPLPTR